MKLEWEGCFNVRDLGGLPTPHGPTPFGRWVRSDGLDRLTEAGWRTLRDHGVRTIVDLRNDDELSALPALPEGLRRLHLPLDGMEDTEFWKDWAGWEFSSPLYYGPHARRMPERSRRVLQALAEAEGGVVFHCVMGRDRTGYIAALLLAALEVDAEAILADYLLSRQSVVPLCALRGEPDHGPILDGHLAGRGLTLEGAFRSALAELTPVARDCQAFFRPRR